MTTLLPPQKRIARAFGRKAADYDNHAFMQADLIKRIVAQLKKYDQTNGRWIDCGCGTGLFARECRAAGIQCRITGVDIAFESLLASQKHLTDFSATALVADIDALPVKNAPFDGAVIASTYQWLADPSGALSKIGATLKHDGFLAFSVFTKGSFNELFAIQKQFGIPLPVYCPTTDEFIKIVRTSGFYAIHCEPVRKTVYFPTAAAAIKSISAIGGTATAGKSLQRKALADFCSAYGKRFRTGEGVPLTYQAIVGVCKKGPSS